MAAKCGNLNKDGASWNRSISFIKQAFFDFKNEFIISVCQDSKLLKRRDIFAI